MGAPVGNQNARQAKIWQQAIKRALARISNESVDKGLDLIADKLVASAVDGDLWATREIAERMDGKAVATTEITADIEARISGLAPIYGLQPPSED
jgi:hypothetical protein